MENPGENEKRGGLVLVEGVFFTAAEEATF